MAAMKLTEAKINEAQKVIEAVMTELDFDTIKITYANKCIKPSINAEKGMILCQNTSLSDLYVNRLHELNGTEPPPF